MRTNDRTITDLMKAVQSGAAQLPDFQRGWVWDDNRIKALIASIIHNYPVGAAMFLTYGNPEIQFKYKPIEGAVVPDGTVPSELILDGQQRLTSIFNALYSDKPVHTKTDKGKEIDRYYYIDIEKALDPAAENDEVIISVPATRIATGEFGRDIRIDLSTPEKEFEQKRMPLNDVAEQISDVLSACPGNHQRVQCIYDQSLNPCFAVSDACYRSGQGYTERSCLPGV